MRRGAAWVLLCAVAMGFVASVAPGGQLVAIARASSAVAVFPIAGTRYNLPATQIIPVMVKIGLGDLRQLEDNPDEVDVLFRLRPQRGKPGRAAVCHTVPSTPPLRPR